MLITEFAYAFKYPEQNKLTDGREHWSIRQTMVYHQYQMQTQQSTWLVISPRSESKAFHSLAMFLAGFSDVLQVRAMQHAMHEVIITSYFWNWRPFMRDYESEVCGQVRCPSFQTRSKRTTADNQSNLSSMYSME